MSLGRPVVPPESWRNARSPGRGRAGRPVRRHRGRCERGGAGSPATNTSRRLGTSARAGAARLRWSNPPWTAGMTTATASGGRNVVHLAAAVGREREDRQGADPEQREDDLEELGDVRQLDDDPLARGDALGGEPRGEPVGARVELAVSARLPGRRRRPRRRSGRPAPAAPRRRSRRASSRAPGSGWQPPPDHGFGPHSPSAWRMVRNFAAVSASSAPGRSRRRSPPRRRG